MSFSTSVRSLPRRFGVVLTSFLQQPGLAFAHVLPEDRIQAAFDEQGVAFAQEEDEVYTPPIALWALLSQVLFKEEQRSCAAAVSRVVVLLVALSTTAAVGQYRRLLPGAGQVARVGHSPVGLRGGRRLRVHGTQPMALARAAREAG